MYDLQVSLIRSWVSAWFSFCNPLKTMLVISYPDPHYVQSVSIPTGNVPFYKNLAIPCAQGIGLSVYFNAMLR